MPLFPARISNITESECYAEHRQRKTYVWVVDCGEIMTQSDAKNSFFRSAVIAGRLNGSFCDASCVRCW